MKRKMISILAVFVMLASMVSVFSGTGSAESTTTIYKFTFETPNCGSILAKGGLTVGEVVEYPAGSGNHVLRYSGWRRTCLCLW